MCEFTVKCSQKWWLKSYLSWNMFGSVLACFTVLMEWTAARDDDVCEEEMSVNICFSCTYKCVVQRIF